MKIVNIVPGFGGTFYCGNCLRDSGYTKSLINLGHDAMMLPIYLPLTIKHGVEENKSPIFYGAVNIYLKQKVQIIQKDACLDGAFFQLFFDTTICSKKSRID